MVINPPPQILQQFLTSRNPIPETSGKVYKPANATEFDALLSTTKHVVVDFYADWCPPCRAIAPVFSDLADKHSAEGQLAFAKVNVDHVHDIAIRYGVSAMPTFVFFEGGKPGGVNVEGLGGGRGSVVVTGEGLVERVRGADRVALVAVVEALAGKGGKKEE
ncbi:thioredoxin-like protein [Dichotomopilus funicola]|uniref:Thioredoxin-like protein n=1 Tax=Dichotomopilus funicola TaxID=1934379 RepID=A0AAN6V0H4_9PEZI|nr:thioredoxin-like protein [Dichotomopilus funicola]